MITRQDFNNFVEKGFNIIPIAKKIYKDNETPLSIYSRLNQDENSFLLESVEGELSGLNTPSWELIAKSTLKF